MPAGEKPFGHCLRSNENRNSFSQHSWLGAFSDKVKSCVHGEHPD